MGGTIGFVSGALATAALPEDADSKLKHSLQVSVPVASLQLLHFALLLFLEAILNSDSNLVDTAYYFAKEEE